nr:Hcp family type VI secretion system effector [Vibrio cholerae]
MPTPCYISIEGQTQGLITAGACTADSIGDSFVEGHEDEMLVQQFDHVVTVPTDPQSGQPSGQRVHKPFKFTVALNKAVPLLYNALSSGEKLKTVELKWYRTPRAGVTLQQCFFRASLLRVSLSSATGESGIQSDC